MSLPVGLVNRAHVPAHPRVVGNVLRLLVLALFLLTPLLLLLTAQEQGIRSRYDCDVLERAIVAEALERKRLLAEREQLLAPARLRAEAERLGLVPPTLEDLAGRRPRPQAGLAAAPAAAR